MNLKVLHGGEVAIDREIVCLWKAVWILENAEFDLKKKMNS